MKVKLRYGVAGSILNIKHAESQILRSIILNDILKVNWIEHETSLK